MGWLSSAIAIVAGAVILNRIQRERNGEPGEIDANPEFFTDSHGVVHPVRNEDDYSNYIVESRAHKRSLTGMTAADQQIEKQFERYTEKATRADRNAEKAYHLSVERDALAEELESEPAARYTGLMRLKGEMRGEVGLIPWQQAKRAGLDVESFRNNAIHKDKFGRKYLRWEYALDQKATELGYDSGDDFKEAIERAVRQQQKIATMDREIRMLEKH